MMSIKIQDYKMQVCDDTTLVSWFLIWVYRRKLFIYVTKYVLQFAREVNLLSNWLSWEKLSFFFFFFSGDRLASEKMQNSWISLPKRNLAVFFSSNPACILLVIFQLRLPNKEWECCFLSLWLSWKNVEDKSVRQISI